MTFTSVFSPQPSPRIAGFFYLLTFVGGVSALMSPGARDIGNLAGAVCYVVVTILFYGIFKPVSQRISLVAAIFSLVGCIGGALPAMHLPPLPINSLAFFGVYCLLIGYLIFNSTFLPRVLGVLMMFGGLGWLTFVSATFAASVAPYNLFPGMLGEGALTLWLLVKGVDSAKWQTRAAAAQMV
jgi:hypothetical protein